MIWWRKRNARLETVDCTLLLRVVRKYYPEGLNWLKNSVIGLTNHDGVLRSSPLQLAKPTGNAEQASELQCTGDNLFWLTALWRKGINEAELKAVIADAKKQRKTPAKDGKNR